jgi:protein SCO1/2
MKTLKTIRYASWAVVAITVFVALATSLGWVREEVLAPRQNKQELSALLLAGGSFSATDQNGKVFTEKNITGKPTLMFFGFTSCPNICPTTLSELTIILEALKADADKLNVVFVSVDPERDTTKQMADYLSAFDKRIIGLTLTPQELADMSKRFHFYYKRVPLEDGDYTMDHTAGVYMLEANGAFRGILDLHEPEKTKMEKVNMLIKGKP